MSLTPLIPPYVPSAPGNIALLLPAPPRSFAISVTTSGEDADPSYDGIYQSVGQSWAGEVWAKNGGTVTVEGLAILGDGAAFINYFADGGPDLWILASSSDWGATSPNEYMIQNGGASAPTPADVVEWVYSNDLDIYAPIITTVPIELPAITRAVEPYTGATAPSSLTKLI